MAVRPFDIPGARNDSQPIGAWRYEKVSQCANYNKRHCRGAMIWHWSFQAPIAAD